MNESRRIRSFTDEDIVALSLLAWEPVFRSFKRALGPTIYHLIYPDWRKKQRDLVRTIRTERSGAVTLVTEMGGEVVGFPAYEVDREEETGEVLLRAVHPDHQERGIGTELNVRALEEMEAAGMKGTCPGVPYHIPGPIRTGVPGLVLHRHVPDPRWLPSGVSSGDQRLGGEQKGHPNWDGLSGADGSRPRRLHQNFPLLPSFRSHVSQGAVVPSSSICGCPHCFPSLEIC